MSAKIEIRGACENNLKNLDLDIDRGQITVFTGVSGSGKSSLAFDTLLVEARRRFFYTLSHYSRQFLDLSTRPAVRRVQGLSPAISLAQNETQPSKRSTVGTLTDLTELVGLLYARFGERLCPEHGHPTQPMQAADIVSMLLRQHDGDTLAVFAPIAEDKKGAFRQQLASFGKQGFLYAWIDGEILPLTPTPKLEKELRHTIKVRIDVLKVKDGDRGRSRLLRAVERAIELADGYGEFFPVDGNGVPVMEQGGRFSAKGGCPECGFSWPALDARHFSTGSLGRCKSCDGYGLVDSAGSRENSQGKATEEEDAAVCQACDGVGVSSEYDGIRLHGKHCRSFHQFDLNSAANFIRSCLATEAFGEHPAFRRVAGEILAVLDRVCGLGLGYLSMSRRILDLSGGERQRLKLAGVLSENLRGVLYILDEPSQGLHPAEIDQLCDALKSLRDAGNTVVVVDHDERLMASADWILDFGPGGGASGGRLLGKFRPQDAKSFAKTSLTAANMVEARARSTSASASTAVPVSFRDTVPQGPWLKLNGSRLHNLRIPKCRFPMGAMTAVTGVSGAGKTSLVFGTLAPNLQNFVASNGKIKGKSNGAGPEKPHVGKPWQYCDGVDGKDALASLVGVDIIDRKPIAKSYVSMPVSYLEAFLPLRELFASLPEAQVAGLTARSFSLSVDTGRCEECKGRGEIRLSMKFLLDARVLCPTCRGRRYRPNILDVKYDGLSMTDVLELSLDETAARFKNHKHVVNKIAPAIELGLGYLKLGQSCASLSGGEAQRLKLAPHLKRRGGRFGQSFGSMMMFFDEPTAGLHRADIDKLRVVLRRLADEGHGIVVIEHDPSFIRQADWVLDLGPGSADAGGQLVYQGPPKGLLSEAKSKTARYLT